MRRHGLRAIHVVSFAKFHRERCSQPSKQSLSQRPSEKRTIVCPEVLEKPPHGCQIEPVLLYKDHVVGLAALLGRVNEAVVWPLPPCTGNTLDKKEPFLGACLHDAALANDMIRES